MRRIMLVLVFMLMISVTGCKSESNPDKQKETTAYVYQDGKSIKNYERKFTIATGNISYGIRKDGTVLVAGEAGENEIIGTFGASYYVEKPDTSSWGNMVYLYAGRGLAICGMDKNGNLYGDGMIDDKGENILHKYNGSKQLLVIGDAFVTLSKDGNIKSMAYDNNKITRALGLVSDVEYVEGCGNTVIALKKDGTVRVNGHDMWDEKQQKSKSWSDIQEWKSWSDIVDVSCGLTHAVALRADGTVVAAGINQYGQCNVSEWKDIIQVSARGNYTVGLKSDGTVVATGDNESGQCNVSQWDNIVAVVTGTDVTLGLRSDGTAVAVGDNKHHQCDVSEWKDLKTP